MKPRIDVISLPVDDLNRSLAFYREGLGLATEGIDGQAIPFQLAGGLSLFLVGRSEFEKYGHQSGSARGASECILSCAVDSREAVDDLLERAEVAGGSLPGAAKEESWGYTGYFRDPDGHLWEIVHSPEAAD